MSGADTEQIAAIWDVLSPTPQRQRRLERRLRRLGWLDRDLAALPALAAMLRDRFAADCDRRTRAARRAAYFRRCAGAPRLGLTNADGTACIPGDDKVVT